MVGVEVLVDGLDEIGCNGDGLWLVEKREVLEEIHQKWGCVHLHDVSRVWLASWKL